MPRSGHDLDYLSNLMANTYTQIHIQCVFAVKFRQSVIQSVWKDRLHQYIIGIVRNNGHKVISINSMPDHLHLFFGFRPDQSLSDLMRMVKGESSEWINKEKFPHYLDGRRAVWSFFCKVPNQSCSGIH